MIIRDAQLKHPWVAGMQSASAGVQTEVKRGVPKCCKLQGDSFPLRNAGGYSSAHAHVIRCNPLPVVQAAMQIMESSEDVFSCGNCSKVRPHVSR